MLVGKYSEFFKSKSIEEKEESWASIFLLLLVSISKTGIHVVVFSGKDLYFIELFKNVLHELSCTLLEGRDSLLLSLLLELGLQSLNVFYLAAKYIKTMTSK